MSIQQIVFAAPTCKNHIKQNNTFDEENLVEGYIEVLECVKTNIKKTLNGTGYEQYFNQYETLLEQHESIVRERCTKYEGQDLFV